MLSTSPLKVIAVRTTVSLALLCGTITAWAEAPLKLGSPAPGVKVAKWIKGEAISKFEPGKVYVVEFWATWCGPCKKSIPHLTELAKKYAGKVSFTGVNVFEEPNPKDEAYVAKVEKFVSDWGARMDYNVAVDGKDGWMGANWMRAAERPGIPSAFVVDQNGKIAWMGHPMVRLDEVLGQVVAGTYDINRELELQAKEKEEQAKLMAEVNGFLVPLRAKEFAKAVAEMDKAFAKRPPLELNYAISRFNALAQIDVPAAMAYAQKLATGIYSNNPNALNSIAWAMVDDKSTIKSPDYKVAVQVAEAGVAALRPGMDLDAAFLLDTLAYAYYKNGQVAKALEAQEKALVAAGKVKDFDPATKKEIEERLALYRSKMP